MIRKKVLIVGFGPHGICTATHLLHHKLVGMDELAIVDPSAAPVERISEYLRDCATKFLRSGKLEHLHPDPNDLEQFCSTRSGAFARGDRPCVDAWLDHAKSVAERFQLAQAHVRAWVTWFERRNDGLVVTTTQGTYLVEKLVIATGQSRPFYPEWADRYRGTNPLVCSIFDNNFDGANLPIGEDAVVLGSGITAGQVVDVIEANGQRKITLLTRRPLSKGDGRTSSLHWRERKLREQLCGLQTPDERDAMLRAEGDRGTMPSWEIERIEALQAQGQLEHLIADVAHVVPDRDGVHILLRDGRTLHTSLLCLATGFVAELQEWLIHAARKAELPFYPDGTPLLQSDFSWGGGVFLTGRQAFRVGGPFAHNVVGGMIFADEFCNRCS